MNKKRTITFGCILILIFVVWFTYQKVTDDTYEGMSIIPEKHKDIPLYEGLIPTRTHYVIKGNHWEKIYNFYMSELPKRGWKVEDEQSSLDNDFEEKELLEFYSRWRKVGFDGELRISVIFNKSDGKTVVTFDKTPIFKTTSWIEDLPDRIFIYENLLDSRRLEINDKAKIEEIKLLINNALDWDKKELPQREKTSVIGFGNLEIKVFYEGDKEIIFQSEKGVKVMKPEPEFFELTNLKK